MTNRAGKKVKLASIDELLGAPNTEGTVDRKRLLLPRSYGAYILP